MNPAQLDIETSGLGPDETLTEWGRHERPPVRITKLARVRGYWRAHVSFNGRTIAVDRSCGSWLAPEGAELAREAPRAREVVPTVARALQARVKREERRARRVAT